MLLSFSLILILGFIVSSIFSKFNLPGLLGMILTGILLGPHAMNMISQEVLVISPDLREIALIVILIRAGLSLDVRDLRKVGRPAFLMCFVPATFELVTITILAPIFFHISYVEAAIMGTVVAAVSPAVVVPRMIKLMEEGYGKKKSIPQLVMAGASVDDVFVIVLFTAFLGMYRGEGFKIASLASVPISIVLGLMLGFIAGFGLVKIFKKIHIRDTIKVLIILSISFMIVTVENLLKGHLPISSLLAIMAMGVCIAEFYESLAKRLLERFSKIWVFAEVFLFVLVGAEVDIRYIGVIGFSAVILIFVALAFRVIGVNVCLIGTNLDKKEKMFTSVSYLPKATVQAAIGGIPLAVGVSSGNMILSIAVLAILITAPLGAILMDYTYKTALENDYVPKSNKEIN